MVLDCEPVENAGRGVGNRLIGSPVTNTSIILQFSMIKVWDIKTAAKELHVCRETLWRMIRAGKMPHRRVGKRILLTEADVAALLEDAAIRNGATNPFARKNRPKKQKVADSTEKQSENTNQNQQNTNEQQQPDSGGISTAGTSDSNPDGGVLRQDQQPDGGDQNDGRLDCSLGDVRVCEAGAGICPGDGVPSVPTDAPVVEAGESLDQRKHHDEERVDVIRVDASWLGH